MINKKRAIGFNLTQRNIGTPVGMLHKAIGHPAAQTFGCISFGIDGHFPETAERAKIIQPSHMIIMFMRNQHSINLSKRNAQHLFPKIRTATSSIVASSVYTNAEVRRRQSLGSFEVQTAQVHPISGTPVEVRYQVFLFSFLSIINLSFLRAGMPCSPIVIR